MQDSLKEKLEEMGTETKFGETRNLFVRIKGSEYPKEVIATGSHIDTVINGSRTRWTVRNNWWND